MIARLGCVVFAVAAICLQFAVIRVAGEEEKVVVTLLLLVSAKWQCTISDNATHVEISVPHNKCAALKCTKGIMRFGTQLQGIHNVDRSAPPNNTVLLLCCNSDAEEKDSPAPAK